MDQHSSPNDKDWRLRGLLGRAEGAEDAATNEESARNEPSPCIITSRWTDSIQQAQIDSASRMSSGSQAMEDSPDASNEVSRPDRMLPPQDSLQTDDGASPRDSEKKRPKVASLRESQDLLQKREAYVDECLLCGECGHGKLPFSDVFLLTSTINTLLEPNTYELLIC